jgi:hypothetical protein
MVLASLCLGLVLGAPPATKVALVRLEPIEFIESEALEAIRTGSDPHLEFAQARLGRHATLPDDAVAAAPNARAVVWVQVSGDTLQIHVVGLDRKDHLRALPLHSTESSATVAENAASVVRSFLQPLIVRQPEVPLVALPTSAPEPAPAKVFAAVPRAPQAQSLHVWITGGYVGGTMGAAFGWQHGAQLEAALGPWRGLLLGVHASAFVPGVGINDAIRFRVDRQSGAAFTGWWWHWEPFEARVVLGGGVEHLRREVQSLERGVATAPATFWWPVASARVELAVYFGSLGLQLDVGARSAFRSLEFRAAPFETLAGRVDVMRFEAAVGATWRR